MLNIIVREIPIKTIMKCHFAFIWVVIIKNTISSVDEDVEELEPSYIAGGDVKWCG